MNSQRQQPSQLPQSNIAEQAIEALSALSVEEQRNVLEYINAIADSTDEQGDN